MQDHVGSLLKKLVTNPAGSRRGLSALALLLRPPYPSPLEYMASRVYKLEVGVGESALHHDLAVAYVPVPVP